MSYGCIPRGGEIASILLCEDCECPHDLIPELKQVFHQVYAEKAEA